MIALLENDSINVYDKNVMIGRIKIKSNFKNAEIKIGDKTFYLSSKNLKNNRLIKKNYQVLKWCTGYN